MGVVANANQYLSKKVTSATHKVIDGVTRAAALTPGQVQEVEKEREKYLMWMSDMKDEQVQDLINRNLRTIGIDVYHAYLGQLKTLYSPLSASRNGLDELNRIRYFNITKWVTDPTEKNLDKLINVYQVLSKEDCNIALIYNRLESGCQVVMAVSNTDEEQCDPAVVDSFYSRLSAAIKGNFPGVEIKENTDGTGDYGYGVPKFLKESVEHNEKVKSVATVSTLVSDKSEDFISQSMEKLLDGLAPQENGEIKPYTVVLIATPVLNQTDRHQRLYNQYTAISPFAQINKQSGLSESAAIMSNANVGLSAGVSAGVSASSQVGYSAGTTMQVGGNQSQTMTYTNYEVKHCMERIEQQMKRMEQCQAMGMWDFAAYVLSEDYKTTQNVAHMYLALTQGEGSFMSDAAVHIWDGEEEKERAKVILESVQKIAHPVFGLKNSSDETVLMYPALVTPTTTLSGRELARALNFPRKSVGGLPVFECAPFGREVILHSTQKQSKIDESTAQKQSEIDESTAITLGSICHMRVIEEGTKVPLLKDSLTAHTFITGSTGAGKSNAVYTILNGLCPYEKEKKQTTHFLVIEPAKGEYKDVFGGRKDVQVYGTNPRKAKLLRLNPFAFPNDTHVLEHIDRLVEIFNACWPMFAAMPAVLKASIEKAYINCGWSLQASSYYDKSQENQVFPAFRDVMNALPEVVDSKGFSNDTQGDYKGALLTRLESLTNGINGQVLCAADALKDEELFDENVIVDLSRVGSQETKALLMGILILALQEHRMAQRTMDCKTNKGLRHITVLEEAHNLLRRTSTEQSQEGANLQGKSVEMLTNAIAEMRTYGEGFIIADQAPGLLDAAVIRNTNTKIILRLPDESDRKLVGKAAGLNDNQIVELSRLDTGVAAVYQNHWLEPVLCKVTEFREEDKGWEEYKYEPEETENTLAANNNFFRWLLGLGQLKDVDKRHTELWIGQSNIETGAKRVLMNALDTGEIPDRKILSQILYFAVKGNSLIKAATKQMHPRQYINVRIQESLQVQDDLAQLVQEQLFYYLTLAPDVIPENRKLELRRMLM